MVELPGEAVTIVRANEDHNFELDLENLENILLDNNVKDKNVVILSVAGAFRKGKSFLLNFILRYLEAKGDANWLGNEADPLKGFSWRGGSERDTTGILLWSKVYLMPLHSGQEVALLLMDTQGSFDSTSTVKECATVFALSTMISSLQVYNLSQNIQEDDLQHLELFTEYGRLAMENNGDKPFQKLLFLIRDWSYPYDFGFGEAGGTQLLEKRLEISEKQHPQLQQLRHHIRNCFSDVACFLLPHPGLEVATSPQFDGRLSDIQDDFKLHLDEFMKIILSPDKLLPKKIGGRCVTAQDLIAYFKFYVEIFEGGELPEPKSMLDATAEANNLSALARAKDYYTEEMEKICGGDRPYVSHDDLERSHFEIRLTAIHKFSDTKKMGSEELEHGYKERLVKEIDEMFTSYTRFNDGKQITNIVRTPAVLLFIVVICYINSYLFFAIGLDGFGMSIHFLMMLTILAIALWGYARCTGSLQPVGSLIDSFVGMLLDNFVYPSQHRMAQLVAQNMSTTLGSPTATNVALNNFMNNINK